MFFSKKFFKDRAFGWNGLHTFIFSNIIIIATAGTSFLLVLGRVIQVAYQGGTSLPRKKRRYRVLIAGLRLKDERITEGFKQRLERAVLLDGQPGIIVMGGFTGNSRCSEAQAGAQYLIARGVSARRIVKEEASRHTLENMQFAGKLLEQNHNEPVAVISSRYHLYRLLVLAESVGIKAIPIAAEDRLVFSRANFKRMIKEAYYLHWFFSGKLWVLMIRKKGRIQSR